MSEVVLDSSVLIAIFRKEPFREGVLDVLEGAVMSAVNLEEVLTKVADFGMTESPYVAYLLALLGRIEPFTQAHARSAADLRQVTRHAGLSLGDRSCLALALELGAEVYTADRAWSKIEAGCKVHLIR